MFLRPTYYSIRLMPVPDGADWDGYEQHRPEGANKRDWYLRTTRVWGFVVAPFPFSQVLLRNSFEDSRRHCGDMCAPVLCVPHGMDFDSVSTGRGLGRAVLGKLAAVEAGLFHDACYGGKVFVLDTRDGFSTYTGAGRGAMIPRKLADDLFFAALRDVCGIPLWRRWLAWAAVRMFGGRHYKGA